MIAPLRELFKEEVRYVGEKLGMPPEITAAQPFPGSGLALRIHGEATPERLDTLRKADDMFREAIVAAGLHKKLWKYYAKLYRDDADQGGIISLRAVGRVDVQSGGAATIPARLPYDLLERYVQSVRESCPEIRKVVYDVTPGGGSLDAMWLD